jgi:hypothetical protein
MLLLNVFSLLGRYVTERNQDYHVNMETVFFAHFLEILFSL